MAEQVNVSGVSEMRSIQTGLLNYFERQWDTAIDFCFISCYLNPRMREQPETCDKCGGVGWLPAASTLSRKRRKAGISQKAVADYMGVSPQYLCDLENGRRAWNYGLVEEFEKALKQ